MSKKKVLLAVCGSISFYKAFEILSALKKSNFDVYVALSDGVQEFVSYKAFEALCDHPVLCKANENWQAGINHISYSKVDLVLIAPATANTINKLAWGVCDNVFLEVLNAAFAHAKVVIAPAANPALLENNITKNCIDMLKASVNAYFVDPIEKTLACGDTGKGGLASTEAIMQTLKRALYNDKFWEDKTVIITGGATIEKIDSVRGITNFSSGKTSKAIADALFYLGADVTLISSNEYENLPYKLVKFESTIGLKSALDSTKFPDGAYLIMAAAVSDYSPKVRYKDKVKKAEIGEIWNLRLGENEDILSSVRGNIKKVGFKLETDRENAVGEAKRMLNEKHLDAVCLNVLDDIIKLGGDVLKVTFITKNDQVVIDTAPKDEVALKIAAELKKI